MDLLRQIHALLTPGERRRAGLLLLMILVMACFDVVGVASIMPFMAVLSNPDVIDRNEYLSMAYRALGFDDRDDFLFFLGVFVFLMLVLSIAFKAFTNWALLRFTHMRAYTLGRRLITAYLHQPYEWYLSRNSAGLSKSILSEVNLVVNGSLVPTLQLLAHGSVVIAILTLLIVVNPAIALGTGLLFGTMYGAIYMVLRKRLTELGRKRNAADTVRFKTLNEVFGGIKDVKLGGHEGVFLRRYDEQAKIFARAQSAAAMASQLPKYALEGLAFGGVLAVCLYLMSTEGRLDQALPMLALYALAGYRLMPALQHTYAQMALLRFSKKALDDLHADLAKSESAVAAVDADHPFQLRESLVFEGVSYQYPEADRRALDGLCMRIPARSTVGLVGGTGSGKTTTVDILLGLLEPQRGKVLIDGEPLTPANLRAWQRLIGYVPQHVYLTDDTIWANIAFGVEDGEAIDRDAVMQAARMAHIHDFIVNELPGGYGTRIGERGIRLSGGQRQRLGIARALYRRPRLLVLDEATSALDNVTERAVMEQIYSLGRDMTIILIAHRLSTIEHCDSIFFIGNGECLADGSYSELLERSPEFREMVNARAREPFFEAGVDA